MPWSAPAYVTWWFNGALHAQGVLTHPAGDCVLFRWRGDRAAEAPFRLAVTPGSRLWGGARFVCAECGGNAAWLRLVDGGVCGHCACARGQAPAPQELERRQMIELWSLVSHRDLLTAHIRRGRDGAGREGMAARADAVRSAFWDTVSLYSTFGGERPVSA
jgi:hypothetical protein